MTETFEDTVERNIREHYDSVREQIAERLISLAGRIRREDDDVMRSAMNVLHELQWGFANLPTDSMLRAAVEFDRFVHDRIAQGK